MYAILLFLRFFDARFDALRYGAGVIIDALDSDAIDEGSD